MFTTPTVLPNFKVVISTKSRNDTRFTHEKIEQTPQFEYRFGQNGNWDRHDARLPEHRVIYKFVENYWCEPVPLKQPKYHYFGRNRTRRILNANRSTTRLAEYEFELEQAVYKAKADLDRRWNARFKQDFENEFNEDLVKFLKSK